MALPNFNVPLTDPEMVVDRNGGSKIPSVHKVTAAAAAGGTS
jgi:hypothetical protein